MPVVFADQPGYIVAPEQIESGESDRPIGTGPFVFQEWVPDRYFKAVRNDSYWREGYPLLDSIEFQPMPDPDHPVQRAAHRGHRRRRGQQPGPGSARRAGERGHDHHRRR